LRAEDPLRPPVFTRLDLSGAANLRLENLSVDLPLDGVAIDLSDAKDVELTAVKITGPAAGSGFDVTNAQRVTITDGELAALANGVIGLEPRHFTLSGTQMTDLTAGAVRLVGGAWITLDGNSFTAFAGKLEHPHLRAPDMVQLAVGQAAPSYVLIKDNLVDSGAGPARPGIVVGDALDLRPELPPMQEVSISGNVVVTPSRDGLAVGPARGMLIARNAILRTRQGPHRESDIRQTTPQLRVSSRSEDVEIASNWAAAFPDGLGLAGWRIEDNLITQDAYGGQTGHYELVFTDPSQPDPKIAFAPRAGTAHALPGSGPNMLRPGLDATPQAVSLTSTAPDAPYVFLSFDPDAGRIASFSADGQIRENLEVDRTSIPIGNAFPMVEVPKTMIAPIFDARDFSLRVKLRGRPGWQSGGEVLRIHDWMILNVDDAGGAVLHFRNYETVWTKLVLRNTRIEGDVWHDLEIRFDTRTADGLVRMIHHNSGRVADTTIHGPTPPMRTWELTFGNPFGDRPTWEGEIGGFTLSRRSMP
jgi:hypothetical protein